MSEEDPKKFMKWVRQQRKRKIVTMSDGNQHLEVKERLPMFYSKNTNISTEKHKAPLVSIDEASIDEASIPETAEDQDAAIESHPQESDGSIGYQSGSVFPTTEAETYLNLLATHDSSVMLINNSLIAIMSLQKDGAKLVKLKATDFVYVINIGNELLCSCNADNMKLKMTLDTMKIERASTVVSQCLHLKIAKQFHPTELVCWQERNDTAAQRSDDHSYDIATEEEIFPLGQDSVAVYINKEFSTVYVKNKHFLCSCPGHRGDCRFIKLIKRALEDTELPDFLAVIQSELEGKNNIYKSSYRQTSHSSKAREITTKIGVNNKPSHHTGGADISIDRCPTCDIDLIERFMEIPCYKLLSVANIYVPYRICSRCNKEVHCDGGDVEILNMGDYAATHELLRDYLKLFVGDGVTLHSYYRKWYWTVLEHSEDMAFLCSYIKLRNAWLSFITLLDTTDDVFTCHTCGSAPEVVICDGLTLGFQKRHRLTSPVSDTPTEKLSGIRMEDTVMITKAAPRKTLTSLTTIDAEVLEQLEPETPPAVLNCLSYLCQFEEIPRHWRRLIRDIASPSPVSSYINNTQLLEKSIDELAAGELSAANMLALQEESPVLFSFISSADSNDLRTVVPLLRAILVVLRCITDRTAHILPDHDETYVETSLQYFPALSQKTTRGTYTMDKKKAAEPCNKKTKIQRTLLPGIFLVHCQHGVNYGFHVMDTGESPDIPFTVFRTRFRKAPKVVIYDNACNLHRYCLNRDPGFFKETLFFVDKMHWWNHTACSNGYNIRLYVKRFSEINTQMAEQRNSVLRRLKAMLSYMSQDNFMHHLILYLWFRNALLKSKRGNFNHILQTLAPMYTKL